MKKLAAITALAVAMAGPALANKSYNKSSSSSYKTSPAHTSERDSGYVAPGSDYTLKEGELRQGDIIKTEKTTWRGANRKPLPGEEVDFTGRYSLMDGRSLEIDGTTAFLIDGGSRFYAPNGSYVTNRAETFFTDSGQVLRMEDAPQMVAVDTDQIVE